MLLDLLLHLMLDLLLHLLLHLLKPVLQVHQMLLYLLLPLLLLKLLLMHLVHLMLLELELDLGSPRRDVQDSVERWPRADVRVDLATLGFLLLAPPVQGTQTLRLLVYIVLNLILQDESWECSVSYRSLRMRVVQDVRTREWQLSMAYQLSGIGRHLSITARFRGVQTRICRN